MKINFKRPDNDRASSVVLSDHWISVYCAVKPMRGLVQSEYLLWLVKDLARVYYRDLNGRLSCTFTHFVDRYLAERTLEFLQKREIPEIQESPVCPKHHLSLSSISEPSKPAS